MFTIRLGIPQMKDFWKTLEKKSEKKVPVKKLLFQICNFFPKLRKG